MRKIRASLICLIWFLWCNFFVALGQYDDKNNDKLTFSIIYDNYDLKQDMESDWGFSCLIEGLDKTILFDTGAEGRIFKQNLDALSIDINKIDYVVLSHDHYDHIGGLETILDKNNKVKVFMLKAFSKNTKNVAVEYQSEICYCPKLNKICDDVYLSGKLGYMIKEQSLAIKTDKGLIVVVGCSHPGIIHILKHFKKNLNQEIYMVLGGFHLMNRNEAEMIQIIEEMKELGVKKCGATHCTGNRQIEMFRNTFGADFIQMGTGKIIEF